MATNIHPAVNKGLGKAAKNFKGGTLRCHCKKDPVVVEVTGQIAHNHICGCTKCWKPKGALFSMVAVAPTGNVRVVSGAKKLKVVDKKALIQRHACKDCGVHMHGPVTRDKHGFDGLTFLHVELSKETGWQPPQFAAFVSSIIESGADPKKMNAVRRRIRDIGLEPYDCLNPGLMDYLAVTAAKNAGTLHK
jgi:S-(hydroxymethyl)glutathione synthase